MTSDGTKSLPDVLAAVTLGPEDRLVLAFPRNSIGAAEAEYMESLIVERGLSGRVVLAVGADDVIVLRATKAEGSTVGQCGDFLEREWPDRPGFGSYHTCHLAYGHTGMHSDGEATWTNVPAVCDSWAFLDMGTALRSGCVLAPGHAGRHRDELGRLWSNEGSEESNAD